ncbi:Methyltransferase domain-containing protein [Tardiphaga sp. OK246]|nr:Methyltransferase domain-containing protein [Tardiphaga sp. OK246]
MTSHSFNGTLIVLKTALKGYRATWMDKPVLRLVYGDIFERIVASCRVGTTLEIGGGAGNLKEAFRDVISSDIQYADWLDVVADAQKLPFCDQSFDNIVMLDVLHHLEFPALFLAEAQRTLRPGGRIVLVEPAITWGSWLFYKFIHHEPVDMSATPLVNGTPDPKRNAYDSNQAIPTLLAGRFRKQMAQLFPSLRIANTHWFSFFVYPLSGGFKKWSLISINGAKAGLSFEKCLERALGRWLGFRMLIVIEKDTLTSRDGHAAA